MSLALLNHLAIQIVLLLTLLEVETVHCVGVRGEGGWEGGWGLIRTEPLEYQAVHAGGTSAFTVLMFINRCIQESQCFCI